MREKRYIILILVAVLIASTVAISLGNKERRHGQTESTPEQEDLTPI